MLCMFNTPSKCFFHCANFSSLVLIGCPFSFKMVDVGLALFALMSYNFLKKSPCRLCFKLSSKYSIILSSSHLSQSFLTALPTALQRFQCSLGLPASCIHHSCHLLYAFLFASLHEMHCALTYPLLPLLSLPLPMFFARLHDGLLHLLPSVFNISLALLKALYDGFHELNLQGCIL